VMQAHFQRSDDGPQVVAWELTRRCPLACRHCRASARNTAYEGELTTEECMRVVDSLVALGSKPLLILTGGEPLSRADVWTIAKRASGGGLRVVMAPCGISVDDEAVRRMRESGITAISLSVDGATAEAHDAFRGVTGSFAANLKAMNCARRAGLPFQINALVSRATLNDLPAIRELALREGASQLDLFFLVPVGRGAGIREFALAAGDCESALEWAVRMNARGPLRIKTTCAPQVIRVRHRLNMPVNGARPGAPTGGCMAGRGFVFISHTGILQPCGFCDVPAGDLRKAGLDFNTAYKASDVFRKLQDVDGYGGKCGVCEYRAVCGGCRARALAATGDYLAGEPSCSHQPTESRMP
jgi:radical SAM protein with 4Fe4S-binding SPASM domain